MALPIIIADLESSLAAKIAVGGTTGTLVSNVDDDGVTLPDGVAYFTLDGNNSAKEHIRCTKTGTALSAIYSYSRQGVATSGTVREHRVGAKVIMTDYATYKNYFEAATISGPGSSTSGNVVSFNGTGGNTLEDSGIAKTAVTTLTGTQTLTSKRVTPRVATVADAATITPTADDCDIYTVTALAQAATIAAPSGTPTNGQKLIIRLLDNATGRALTWNSIYKVVGTTLPTTTVASKYSYVGCVYSTADSKWHVVAVVNEI